MFTSVRGLNPLNANLQNGQMQIADELFECVWPFCGIGV